MSANSLSPGLVTKLIEMLPKKDRKLLVWLLLLLIVSAMVEMAGVASVVPFLNIVADPKIIETDERLSRLYQTFEFVDDRQFLLTMGIVVFFLLIVSVTFRAISSYAMFRFALMKRHTLCRWLMEEYLKGPYTFHLNRHSSDLTEQLFTEVGKVVTGVMGPMLQLIARGLVILFILALLFLMDPIISLIASLALGGSYVAIYFAAKRVLARIGIEIVEASKEMYQAANEAFGGMKEIKYLQKEQIFLERLSVPSERHARAYVVSQFISEIPRFGMEIVAFGGILAIVLYLIWSQTNFQSAIPTIGLYVYAGYRLMPALQQFYASIAQIRISLEGVHVVYDDIVKNRNAPQISDLEEERKGYLSFRDEIEICNLTYTYPGSSKPALQNLNINIKANAKVGLVGPTGSGKSTLVDILLGLLHFQDGNFFVDGVAINETNLSLWQHKVGYVPQSIFLCDASIAQNVAFGVPPGQIDMDSVKKAIAMAGLDEFVEKELPDSYNTVVGERGIRFSGGQRQRVGIARALYHDPDVIIMDEATSALDGITEKIVMEAIHRLGGKKTIVLIAHRLSTVRDCDIIYAMENGKVSAFGTYEELIKINEQFRGMAKASA
tara:strand:- start:12 stop:1835 length:1824 start_codon:yes stop_codon:yes gene_type:complete